MTYVMRALNGPLGVTYPNTPSFTCSGSICYSKNSPETHALFKAVQASINKFSSHASFSPVTVDGKFGAGTAAALKKVYGYLQLTYSVSPDLPRLTAVAVATTSKENLAASAKVVYDALTYFISKMGMPVVPPQSTDAPPVSTGGGGGGGGGTPVTLPPPTVDIFQPGSMTTKRHWAWYVAGGLLAVSVAAGVWMYMSPGNDRNVVG